MNVIEAKEPFLNAEPRATSSKDGVGRDSNDLTLVQDDQKHLQPNKSSLRSPYYATNWVIMVSNLVFFFWIVWRVFNGRSYCPDDAFCKCRTFHLL